MMRPRREEFILDVRRSAKTLQNPNFAADSDVLDTDAISRILQKAELWLTPNVVQHYEPEDFASYQSNQQHRLRLAVEDFRNFASQVPSSKPATVDQFMEGAERFREVITVLGDMIREEWLSTIDSVERQAEEWSGEAGWLTRRENKKMSESLIGPYDATQLLIYAEQNLYVLDPTARFVPGAQGAFDFGIQPSYHTTSMYRDDNGTWYVHLSVSKGVANGQRVEWDRAAFHKCIEQLGALVRSDDSSVSSGSQLS